VNGRVKSLCSAMTRTSGELMGSVRKPVAKLIPRSPSWYRTPLIWIVPKLFASIAKF